MLRRPYRVTEVRPERSNSWTLVQKFPWIISVFGVILILSGIKMTLQKDQKIHPERNLLLRK